MSELLTSAQMRAVEQAAISSGAVTGLALMERAGEGVVSAILTHWPDLARHDRKAVVLCGPGNNGGDGFVIARLLQQKGWRVEVYLLGAPDMLPPDARANYDRWREIGPVAALPFESEPGAGSQTGIVIDALFGTGLTRGLDPDTASILATFDRSSTDWARVAVDIPSGLCADSGRPLLTGSGQGGAAFRADLTVTFHMRKNGHVLADGPRLCGVLRVASIGLSQTGNDTTWLVDSPAPFVNDLAKSEGHKYGYGHALVLAGGSGKGGAARLAARAALRIGAGLVTVAPTPGALQENAARLDAIMLAPVADAATLDTRLQDPRLNALCLGPGLGLERARDLVPCALSAGRATVLDADAITAFADAPQTLFKRVHDTCVLTPHMGEFARLFPDLAEHLSAPATSGPAYARLDAAADAAARAGCTVLLKGPDTVIAAPDGARAVHAAVGPRAAPWLATAGSGDVLAGLITGLLARGFAPFSAACAAAWLHAEAARSFGPGLIAEDIPEQLPALLGKMTT
ncbi:NAD(P)H-hydrate dehydratase [Maritimibacter dapengensis]|uniref:Bifunctional NAD(P)H-hydrate repair enzyme n=1 Tax=Maritimibacter dapengensis TaxID=2836868 RepID=A0ABS6T4G9_9RHOB|nr:NAD(P)H-hydrate dehydratase [Maritimibacter dapengensis]MBV7379247.1 NAD(P)H-hydrate dehydratase [Maritimibacter dapengensis]